MANIIDIVVRAKDSTAGAFKKVGKASEKLKAKLKAGFAAPIKAAKMLSVAIALVGAAAVAAAKSFIGFASAAEEIDTKFAAVFASSKSAADAIANDLAASFDLADSTAKEMLGNIGDLLTGFGFTGAEALEMADKVSRLGIDLASFTNYSKGASGATEALTKLLLGESEQAKSLGIVVRQGSDEYKNAVKAKQADLGVSLLQAKAMTALEMATNQSKNAIGDYARTQEGVANRQRKANEAFKQAREDIGAAIIAHSSYGDILNMVAEKTKELTESGLIELWAENVAKAVKWLMPIVEKLGKVFGTVKATIQKGAAILGALSAGASVREAEEAGAAAGGIAERERKERLAAILKEKEEEKAAAYEAAKEAEAIALNLERLTKARKLAEENVKTAVDATRRAAEKAEKVEKNRLAIAEKLAALKQQQAQAQAQAVIANFQKAAVVNQGNINAAQNKIAGIALNKEQRRAAQIADRQENRDNAREKELKGRVARGVKLGKDNAAFLAKRKQLAIIAQQQGQKAINLQNAQARIDKAAQDARDRIVVAVEKEVALLEANLKAAG